jgi:hypothetical protein
MPVTTRTSLAALAVLATALTPAGAFAKNGADDGPGHDARDDKGGLRDDATSRKGGGKKNRKLVTGTCTDGSTAKLKAKPDDGRLEVEFEVDENRAGRRWTVRIERNDDLVVRRNATTRGRSGSFSVERRIANPAGTDRISARAVSPSGEVCTASLSI